MFNFLKKKEESIAEPVIQPSPAISQPQQPAAPEPSPFDHNLPLFSETENSTGNNYGDFDWGIDSKPGLGNSFTGQPAAEIKPQAQASAGQAYQPVDTSDIDRLFADEPIEEPRSEDFGIHQDEFELPDFDDQADKNAQPAPMPAAASAPPGKSGFFSAENKLKMSVLEPVRQPSEPNPFPVFQSEVFVSTSDYKAITTTINAFDKNISEFESVFLDLTKGLQKQKTTYDDIYQLLDSAQEDLIKIDSLIFGD